MSTEIEKSLLRFFTNPLEFATQEDINIPSHQDLLMRESNTLDNDNSLFNIFKQKYQDLNVKRLAQAYLQIQNKIENIPIFDNEINASYALRRPDLVETFLWHYYNNSVA